MPSKSRVREAPQASALVTPLSAGFEVRLHQDPGMQTSCMWYATHVAHVTNPRREPGTMQLNSSMRTRCAAMNQRKHNVNIVNYLHVPRLHRIVSVRAAVEAPVVEAAGTEDTQDAGESGSSTLNNKQAEAALLRERIAAEVKRRRNFAIISHPDAGKTTLTEKLLLYGGAIHEAGEVKARAKGRAATSDWMELERARGISITSTAMTFDYSGYQINLCDTPGHSDFSEDTYRTLAAVDNAVMLVDGAKGIEPMTRKLFAVARLKGLPIFTFVNKMDRPAMNPFDIMEQLEKEFGLSSFPVTWPIGSGDRFCGILHRPSASVILYTRGERGKVAKQAVYAADSPELQQLIEPDLWEQFQEDKELLEVLGEELDTAEVLAGRVTPMYFGSAFSNFGVEPFLESFVDTAAPPSPALAKGNLAAFLAAREERTAASAEEVQGAASNSSVPDTTEQEQASSRAESGKAASTSGGAATGTQAVEGYVAPESPHFTGLVFKLQSNMDPKHRDKVAFVRVVSGKFEKGMKVKVARTGRVLSLTRPQRMFAQDRSTVQEGFAGDVIGLTNPGAFAIGDTIYSGPEVAFPPIPCFSPELFAYLRCPPAQRKAFAKGVEGLLGEGAVQVLYSRDEYITDPILAAVGQLQFEVVQYRMKDEYGVETTLESLPYAIARWVTAGWPAVEAAGRMFNTTAVKDMYGRPVLLFKNEYALNQVMAEHADQLGELSPYALPQ